MARIVLIGRELVERELKKTLEDTIAEVAHHVDVAAKSNTPVRTGYTKRQWTKEVKKDNFEVANRVPWIERLERGASRKAPRGILGPTLTQVKGKIK